MLQGKEHEISQFLDFSSTNVVYVCEHMQPLASKDKVMDIIGFKKWNQYRLFHIFP